MRWAAKLFLKLNIIKEEHYTLPVVALVDSLNGAEVEVVNRLLPQGSVALLSKPLKREWLEGLFSRYGDKKDY